MKHHYTDITVTIAQYGISLSARVRPCPEDFAQLFGQPLTDALVCLPDPDALASIIQHEADQLQPLLASALREFCSRLQLALRRSHEEQSQILVDPEQPGHPV